ncbi:MAG: hypothetical protein ABI867_45055 [Kofleriaceae bacterium]
MTDNDNNTNDHDDETSRPSTWTERNGATILAGVLVGFFALVMVAQVAC